MTTATETKSERVVIPYKNNEDLLEKNLLERLYRIMEAQDLLPEIFHEKLLSEDEWVEFAHNIILHIFSDLTRNELAGMAWLTEPGELQTHSRAFGAFVFFRPYWNIKETTAYGRICLSQWFNGYNFDMILGMTPELNRAARLYSARMGFKYVTRIPRFTSYHGKRCDGLVCILEKDDFNRRMKNG